MAPFPTPVSPSMEALPSDNPLRQLYPEDLYPNGNYHPSPFGKTRYWIIGEKPSDKKVVLIHGITTPSIVWKDIAGSLVPNGFQVLLYDLYGRGYSEAPEVPSDPNLYAVQLALLLQYIGWENTDIVGFSIGGATAAAFSSVFPHLVKQKIVFMAAAGLLEPRPPGSVPPPVGNAQVAKLRELQTQYLPHFTEVLASSRKEGLSNGLQWAYETLGKSDKRFLIIHGTNDHIVPFTVAHKIQAYIPQAELVPIDGATHYMPMEDGAWQKIAESLVAFLS